jgi:hypothetical protein
MALTLISTHTASASATLDITTGIDSTYDSYEFHFVNMHAATNDVLFQFQVNAAGQTGFNEVMTTTAFRADHNETGTDTTTLEYVTGADQAQGTAYQLIAKDIGNDNDQSASGVLTLYAPSSTTYVKHFVARSNGSHASDYTVEYDVAGYINTTAAIDEFSFKMSSGNIDDGTIKMFGVS